MKVLYFISIIILTACSKEVDIPGDIIGKQEMSQILIDIHLLEGKIKNLKIEGDTSFEFYDHFEKQIFANHQIDSASFKRSLNFYLANPQLMEQIYLPIVDSLTVLEKQRRIK
jgi:hypothetical protein